MNNLSEDLKKVLLAGLGAVAVTAEKSKEVVEQLVKKGELTVEQGKVLNEELKHTVAEKLREPVNAQKVSQDLEKLNSQDLELLKAKIEELQRQENEE
ncbi:aspartyl beta-hydroxylase [Candidatus Stoquefichus sp. SB1]|jgi:polyhydroxyalkanoate synthesis regulator phasin|uniref:aspartyl beta-hydroxylase n=1 Tax=Candidatus Stoquefichus sp. SB1 TaxID=1658109 RepID=UPI00067EAE64|nr:aspartyl beta-hydroxylase [Candidatus Stoquefichus sp. SB1]